MAGKPSQRHRDLVTFMTAYFREHGCVRSEILYVAADQSVGCTTRQYNAALRSIKARAARDPQTGELLPCLVIPEP